MPSGGSNPSPSASLKSGFPAGLFLFINRFNLKILMIFRRFSFPCKGLACKIIGGSALAILIPFVFFFIFLGYYDQQWLEYELRSQARAIYHLITVTRQWISWHGGIYVKNDSEFQLLTPSHFVRSLSLFSKDKLPYTIKIAVENPKNSMHEPDSFEKIAIESFKSGNKEYWQIEGSLYRYAAPLNFRTECLNCHKWSPEKNIAGCISISLDITRIREHLSQRKRLITAFFILTFLLMMISLSFLIRKWILNPLNKFKSTTQKIKEGVYTQVQIHTEDEWQDLAETFNAMISQIKNHQEELEARIAEATEKLRTAYEELKKTDQFKSEFFSNVSHDLKTPLSAIKGTIDFLLRKNPGDQHLLIAQKNVHKLLQMINTILDITRLEHGQLELNKDLVDLRELVEEACLAHQPLAWEKNVTISWKPPEEPLWVEIDSERMYGVVSNILDNALRFSPSNTEVIVRAFKDDGRAVLEIEDYGPGIKSEEKQLIFEKFYHRNSGGLGLGLAISYGIIKAHEGDIWVSDPEDHRGSIFVIVLPLRDA